MPAISRSLPVEVITVHESWSSSNSSSATVDTDTLNPSDSEPASTWSNRGRLVVIALIFLLLSILMCMIGFMHVGKQYEDPIKIIAVALFVCSMVALAIGMIGDFRCRRH